MRKLYEDGEREPVWIRADRQTHGRGRRDRSWTSAPGNLFASGLYPTQLGPAQSALYGFAAALGVAETISSYDLQRPLTLKWPNDVLVGGAKISGILIEREGEALIVGTGINLISHPDNTPYSATHMLAEMAPSSLAQPEPKQPSPETMLPLLVSNLMTWFQRLEQDGFEPLRNAWLEQAHGLGQTIKVNDQTGTFTGLGPDGALCLRQPDGKTVQVHAGDVSFG